jgi:hypothetical protein
MNMLRLATIPRSALWPAIAIALCLLATAGFLHDLGLRELRSWELGVLLVAGATITLLNLPRDGLARALVWYVSLTAAAFLIVYDVLDTLLDPFLRADWPIAAIATLLIWGLHAILLEGDLDDD